MISTPSGSGSNVPNSNVNGALTSSNAVDRPVTTSNQPTVAGVSSSAVLKRKWGQEVITSPLKVSSTRVPGQVGFEQFDLKPPLRNHDLTMTSPTKKTRALITSRNVVDQSLAEMPDRKVVDDLPTATDTRQPDSDNNDSLEERLKRASITSPSTMGKLSAQSPISGDKIRGQDLDSGSSSPTPNDVRPGKGRRTTRLRKATQPNAAIDVFGTVDVPPLLPRRKAHAHASARLETDTFSGMSAVALKALTSSNTTKNQKYIAAKLETEVIRKEGARPDSPTVKVKTILQRQEEEKAQQRKERAERRARRSDDGSGFSDFDGQTYRGESGTGMESDWDQDEQDEQDDCLMDPLPKHRRGPGDEEDYETPDKSERPTKRPRPDEEAVADKKRVKWDRGLSTAIFVDDVQPRTRSRPNKDIIMKGCLAKTAKASYPSAPRNIDILTRSCLNS